MQLLLDSPLVSLFLIIASGLMLGALRIKNISLGASGIIFTSLLFGLLGCSIPAGADTLGLVLFVYAVGVSAGPGFFRVFVRQGAGLAKLGLVITAVGVVVAMGFSVFFEIPSTIAAGVFAGALTSTPGLAAALDVVLDKGAVSVGYGLAYPFGVISVVLFVQLLPKLLRLDLKAEAKQHTPKVAEISRVLIEVTNRGLEGKPISKLKYLKHHPVCLSRILEGEQLIPVTHDTTLVCGMKVLAIGELDDIDGLVELLGKRSEKRFLIDVETRKKVVITSSEVVGKPLSKLYMLSCFGLVASRISRNGVEFVPNRNTILQQADILTVVGEQESIQHFMAYAGHRKRVLNETDLIAVSVGIGGGLLVGMIPFPLPGGGAFSLGLAGGPLLVGLVMAHFGQIGRIRGYIPPAARRMMMNLGLAFFLAGAGIKAGARLPEILIQHGPGLVGMAIAVAFLPMVVGYFFAKRVLKLNVLQILGGIAGGMTSTPGLGAVSDSVESEVPPMSYAAVYPVSLILMTVFTQLIIRLLG